MRLCFAPPRAGRDETSRLRQRSALRIALNSTHASRTPAFALYRVDPRCAGEAGPCGSSSVRLRLAPPSRSRRCAGPLLGVDDDSLKWYGHTSSLLSIYDARRRFRPRHTRLDTRRVVPVRHALVELQRAAGAGRSIRVVLAVTGPVDAAAIRRCVARRLLRLHRERPAPLPVDPRRRDLDRAELRPVLAAASGRGSRVREPPRHLLGRAALGAAGRECDRDERSARESRPVVRGSRHGVPGEPPHAAGLRHSRSQRVSRDVGRGAGRAPRQALAFDRRGRPRPPARRAPQGLRRTEQPLPGTGGVTVWYLEDGFQTVPGRGGYTGAETGRIPSPRTSRRRSSGPPFSSRTASRPSAPSSTSSSATMRPSTAGSRASSVRTGARSPRSPLSGRRCGRRPPGACIAVPDHERLRSGEFAVKRAREASI